MNIKKNLLLIFFGFFSITSCQTQTNKASFGNYYKIDKYDIEVPFAGQPHISPIQDNGVIKYVGYQYAYPKPTDDINFLYGIDVCELKTDTIFSNENSKIEFFAGTFKLTYEKMQNGKIIKEEGADFRGKYSYKQKIRINIPNVGEVFINSIFFSYQNVVIRLYTFTPLDNDDNQRINDFFESVKYK